VFLYFLRKQIISFPHVRSLSAIDFLVSRGMKSHDIKSVKQVFREQGIDDENDLLRLSDSDFKEMGIGIGLKNRILWSAKPVTLVQSNVTSKPILMKCKGCKTCKDALKCKKCRLCQSHGAKSNKKAEADVNSDCEDENDYKRAFCDARCR